ncbi:MAG: DUF2283 domain-containing protein [Chloroflexia bacterium]|nr:DUF2283 domain-containing protein [Chloroflexia bacterium]
MKITYDPETDTMIFALRDVPICESDEVQPGVIADFGDDGGIVRFEILSTSTVVDNTHGVEFARGSVEE